MPALCGHDVIRIRTLAYQTQIQARFLFHFAASTILNRFAPLQVPAWERPCTRTVRPAPQTQQHLAAAYDDHTHSYLRL